MDTAIEERLSDFVQGVEVLPAERATCLLEACEVLLRYFQQQAREAA